MSRVEMSIMRLQAVQAGTKRVGRDSLMHAETKQAGCHDLVQAGIKR